MTITTPCLYVRLETIDHLSPEIQQYYSLRPDGTYKLNTRIRALKYVKKTEIAPKIEKGKIRSFKRLPISDVSHEMREMYLSGKTLQEIGDEFGVTRERIRQILKQLGLKREDGGITIKTKPNKEKRLLEKLEKREARNKELINKRGFSLDEWRVINDKNLAGSKKPITAFHSHHMAARHRGIEFKLSFFEWWNIWQDSGKWENRGRGIGKYCMSRLGDSGAYEIGNVEIKLATENSSEGILRTRSREQMGRTKESGVCK